MKKFWQNIPLNWFEAVIQSSFDSTVCLRSHNIRNFLFFLFKSEDFQTYSLLDLWVVDNLKFSYKERFQLNYLLYSLNYQQRYIVRFSCSTRSVLDSVSGIYPSAVWFEREAWDLFGVFFKDHPDLRRILTDYGFVGHPLLKDFPLTGYFEVRFDLASKRVIQENIKMTQEYRHFDFLTPWNH